MKGGRYLRVFMSIFTFKDYFLVWKVGVESYGYEKCVEFVCALFESIESLKIFK